MKTLYKLFAAAGLALMVMVAPVHAALIQGEISFAGGFKPTGGTLATATGIDFTNDSFTVTGADGDFAGTVGHTGSIYDFTFNPFPPGGVTPLWTLDGFSFDLLTLTAVSQDDDLLILRGQGVISHAGYDDTKASWILTGNTVTGSNFSWSATTAVPETLTLTMFGLGLLGMGVVVRRRKMTR